LGFGARGTSRQKLSGTEAEQHREPNHHFPDTPVAVVGLIAAALRDA